MGAMAMVFFLFANYWHGGPSANIRETASTH
jgi:hypothetical protein